MEVRPQPASGRDGYRAEETASLSTGQACMEVFPCFLLWRWQARAASARMDKARAHLLTALDKENEDEAGTDEFSLCHHWDLYRGGNEPGGGAQKGLCLSFVFESDGVWLCAEAINEFLRFADVRDLKSCRCEQRVHLAVSRFEDRVYNAEGAFGAQLEL